MLSSGGAPRARASALILVLLCSLPSQSNAQEPGSGPVEVRDLRFSGASHFTSDELRSAIITGETRCSVPFPVSAVCLFGVAEEHEYIDEAVLRADLLRLRLLYYQHGYREPAIEVERVPLPIGIRLVFNIDEGEPVRVAAIEIAGAAGIFEAGIAGRLPLGTGQPFSLLDYEASRDSLIERMRNRGYAHADALAGYTIGAETPHRVNVRYELIPGARARFGSIEVIGADRVSPAIVERLLTFESGELYRRNDLVQSQRNLFQLDIFRHAEIRPELERAANGLIPITVQVNEGDVHRVQVGAGVSTAECVNTDGSWTSRNFLGGARRLELRGRLSNVLAEQITAFPCSETGDEPVYRRLNWLLSGDFTQPWFLGSRNTLRSGVFFERRSVPGVFVREGLGGYTSLVRSLGPQTSVSLGYRPELTRLDAESDVFFCLSFVACAFDDIERLQERHWLAPITLSLARDRSNALFAPTRGYTLELDFEHASAATGSDFAYDRVLGDLAFYRGLFGGVVLATRVRPGWAWVPNIPAGENAPALGLHPQKRFFAGGPNSVRGFAQYRLGPKVLTVDAAGVLADPEIGGCSIAQINDGSCSPGRLEEEQFDDIRPIGGQAILEGSFELRFPLWGNSFRGAAFVDFGQVWPSGGAVDLGDLAWTPGLGIRYFSPIGPIRVDLGYYHPSSDEDLRVITTEVAVNDEGELVNTNTLQRLDETYDWYPFDPGEFMDRLQLHFSIGQAF